MDSGGSELSASADVGHGDDYLERPARFNPVSGLLAAMA
jgi:hypothetical protein